MDLSTLWAPLPLLPLPEASGKGTGKKSNGQSEAMRMCRLSTNHDSMKEAFTTGKRTAYEGMNGD